MVDRTPSGCALSGLAEIAATLGDGRLETEASSLAERLAEGRFYVACVGDFKRGKSTLLNALIGTPILPTGVVPVTAVPIVVRFGQTIGARVRLHDDQWREIAPAQLACYVTEDKNPSNAAGVTAVEVFAPSPLLAGGMCFVDTPGLGSVFHASTAATERFVPHVDAALVVVGADPPISADELELVSALSAHVSELIVVLNKADRVSDEERREAAAFADRVIAARIDRAVEHVYVVSAAERLAGAESRDWPALVAALRELCDRSGRSLVRVANERGLARIAAECVRQIDEHQAALLSPIDRMDSQVDAVGRCVADAERATRELVPLVNAERLALSRSFADRREAFLAMAMPAASAELGAAIDSLGDLGPSRRRRRAFQDAREIARRHVEPWLAAERRAADDAYRHIAERFVHLSNRLFDRLAESAGVPRDALPHALLLDDADVRAGRFFFHDLAPLVHATQLRDWWLDRLTLPSAARRAVRRDAEHMTQLLTINATRVQNELDERVLERARQLGSTISERLVALTASATRALTRARAAHASGAESVREGLAHLDALRRRVGSLVRDH